MKLFQIPLIAILNLSCTIFLAMNVPEEEIVTLEKEIIPLALDATSVSSIANAKAKK